MENTAGAKIYFRPGGFNIMGTSARIIPTPLYIYIFIHHITGRLLKKQVKKKKKEKKTRKKTILNIYQRENLNCLKCSSSDHATEPNKLYIQLSEELNLNRNLDCLSFITTSISGKSKYSWQFAFATHCTIYSGIYRRFFAKGLCRFEL
jgi:hypothetical protein